jgi:uncharacterized membrane protein YfcA
LGLASGAVNGLLGAGGGILLVLILPKIFKKYGMVGSAIMEGRDFYATALAIMLPASVISAIMYFSQGNVPNLSTVALLSVPSAIGGYVGAVLLGRLNAVVIKKIFSALVIFAGFRMIVG